MRFMPWLNSVIILFFVAISGALAQKPAVERPLVAIQGTGLSLQQPDGFEKAETFHGFQQESTGSSVMVTILPGPVSEVTKGFTKDNLAARGMQLLSQQNVRIFNRMGLLLNLSQNAYGTEFQKWILVAGDETEIQIVTATFPASMSQKLSDALRASVLSVTPSSTGAETPSLPFQIGTVEGLTSVKGIAAMGKMALFTKNGQIPATLPTDPLFVVAMSLGDVPIDDPRTYAMRRLHQTADTRIDRIEKVSDILIDRIKGVEIEAVGQDQKSGEALAVFQVMLFPEGGGYILMTGMVGTKEKADYLPKFRTLARTYQSLSPGTQ